MHTCQHCNKSFKSELALRGHSRIHNESNGKLGNTPMCCCVITRKVIAVPHLPRFQKNIKFCLHCNKPLDSNRKFCDQSCAAKHSNNTRAISGWTPSKEQKEKTAESFSIRRVLTKEIAGPYSRIFLYCCESCKENKISRVRRKKCNACSGKSREKRRPFLFKFNIEKYPDLFDMDYIKKVGWFSPGKTNDRNLTGLSKDHKVSISDAIENNYDPYYISHPINCDIVTQKENSSKNHKSSISYDELVRIVDCYEENRKWLHELDSNQQDLSEDGLT